MTPHPYGPGKWHEIVDVKFMIIMKFHEKYMKNHDNYMSHVKYPYAPQSHAMSHDIDIIIIMIIYMNYHEISWFSWSFIMIMTDHVSWSPAVRVFDMGHVNDIIIMMNLCHHGHVTCRCQEWPHTLTGRRMALICLPARDISLEALRDKTSSRNSCHSKLPAGNSSS